MLVIYSLDRKKPLQLTVARAFTAYYTGTIKCTYFLNFSLS